MFERQNKLLSAFKAAYVEQNFFWSRGAVDMSVISYISGYNNDILLD